jgi:tungstate transport system ATP-binding protein
VNDIVYRLEDVIKEYDGRRVLHASGLEIQSGEVFAMVGPSGAGKSTLLRMLNFLEPPDQGSIIYRGIPYNRQNAVPLELRRRVTTVFQRPTLLERSVIDNVSYGLRLRGMRNSHQRTHSALEKVGMLPLARQRARTLSGGEAQRVALARAMVIEPDVLLLDEPTANLDPYNIGLIEKIILDLNKQQGATLVLVTHNIFQARRLADRVAFLLDGQIVEVASNDTFFNHPSDPRTAAFVHGDIVY